MIEITAPGGDIYKFDPSTQRLFKGGLYIPPTQIEPVYSGNDKDNAPIFAGLFLKSSNQILTKTGKLKPITDINSIK